MNRSVRFNLYTVLRVSRTASTAEIKAAFRSLALRLHPDKHDNSPESNATFKTIHNAYTILSNREDRERYDRVLGAAPVPAAEVKRTDRAAPLLGPNATPAAIRSLLLDHLSFVLWDIEDLLPAGGRAAGAATDECILMMLTFIDRWVLQPAGFPDYFFQARGLAPSAPVGGRPALPYANLQGGHQPYTDSRDYFYDVRRRVDELFRKSRLIDFSSPLTGMPVSLAECVLEAHNYCVYYLGWMKAGSAERGKADAGIPPFHHSQPVFERRG